MRCPKIFEPDEQRLGPIPPEWDRETLLSQESIFFLKDVANALQFEPLIIKNIILALRRDNKSPWLIMGIRKVFSHWIVRMSVFSVWYKASILSQLRLPEPGCSPKVLIQQHGIFLLRQACAVLQVVSAQQFICLVTKDPEKAREIGVWKDEETQRHYVAMEVFGPWVQETWRSIGMQRIFGEQADESASIGICPRHRG